MENNNKLSSIKALVFDLDGTLLLPNKTIGERTRRALAACMEKGIRPILATGRGVESVEPYRRFIDAAGPHVYFNGAEVLDMPSRKMIYAGLLEAEPALFCLELARKQGHYFQVYFPEGSIPREVFGSENAWEAYMENGEALLMEKPGPESEYYRTHSAVEPHSGNLEAALLTPGLSGIIKGMFITDEKYHEDLRRAITERFGDSVTVTRSSPEYLEILAKGVSKGGGLIHALESLNIAPEHAIAFGDEENDLPMFTAAGFSAAPANAVKAVLEAASFHIPSDADEGIASFLEERILG